MPHPAKTPHPGVISGSDYLNLPDHETWLIRPLIPAGGSAVLYGDPKLGKSYLGLQMALALVGATPDFLGFPIAQTGPVVYLQLDTPRPVWRERLQVLKKDGLPVELIHFADRETIEHYPLDILQPIHGAYLKSIVGPVNPVAVFIDTVRDSHSGEEDSSTTMRNVVVNFRAAFGESAIILISHARKPSPDVEKNLLSDMRGSSAVVGAMDAILRLTKRAIYYTGRSIEEGSIRLERQENGLWLPDESETSGHLAKVMTDPDLKSMRSKARILAPLIHKSEEAAMSMIRRATEAIKAHGVKPKRASDITSAVTKIEQGRAEKSVEEVSTASIQPAQQVTAIK